MVNDHFDRYEIHWANPQGNRCFTIQCRSCLGACTGCWAKWQEGATHPEADEKTKKDGINAVRAVAALRKFVEVEDVGDADTAAYTDTAAASEVVSV